jgi:hypothetical protein
MKILNVYYIEECSTSTHFLVEGKEGP